MASDDNDNYPLYIANCITSSLSMMGSLYMSYSCIKSQAFHTASGKLILAIAFSDFFYSIANVMSIFKSDVMDMRCYTEGFLRVWSLELNLFFPSCIAILCYKATDLGGRGFNQERFAKRCIPIGVIAALLMAFAPFFLDNLTFINSKNVCFAKITSPQELSPFFRTILYLLYGGLPIISALLITITCYILTIIKMKEISQLLMDRSKIDTYRLLWYPAVLFITFVPNILIDVGLTFYGTKIKALEVLSVVITHSLGFSNALVYGIQRKEHQKSENLREYVFSKSGSFNSMNAELIRAAGNFGEYDNEDKLYFD